MALSMITLETYQPHEKEPYMNGKQKAWFRKRLLEQREALVQEARRQLREIRETDFLQVSDMVDRSVSEIWREQQLRVQVRFREVLDRNTEALRLLEEGDYGYCSLTGEPIGIPRLLAVPDAIFSFEAQQLREKRGGMMALS
ncbi:TraR/DksA family transcriptional regulator [Desulfobotulus sp. H1]|uniref:TraR/DksA family transcriptional regulator n=1 Tax=Desulfobotulus pelophilus TaxID=2823377 RepID=A0ABT3N7F3_9BACT|nr:TraR/DksA family transcriptional regulator [Desulfobotulus pelophilus]MCW7753382.1 TraR/DksA family transcriptional regulator [Desulfobotulus pelophilus]